MLWDDGKPFASRYVITEGSIRRLYVRVLWLAVLIGCCSLSLTACRPNLLQEALKGKLRPEEKNNEVITRYCQSCHIHRAFEPVGHIPRMQALYDSPPYTTTTQCRTCHLVRKNTWGVHRRKTVWPADVATKSGEKHDPTSPSN
jgi:hypothetical protein